MKLKSIYTERDAQVAKFAHDKKKEWINIILDCNTKKEASNTAYNIIHDSASWCWLIGYNHRRKQDNLLLEEARNEAEKQYKLNLKLQQLLKEAKKEIGRKVC